MREQSPEHVLPQSRYDIVTKNIMGVFGEQILRFLTENNELHFIEQLETELPTVEMRRMDSLCKVSLNGESVLVHCEFQVGDSTQLRMERRNVGYLGRVHERYGLPVLSHVIYLRPDAGRRDTGVYRHEVRGYLYVVEYKVIRLIEQDGGSVLNAGAAGLLPFAPLMRPPAGLDKLQWAAECHEATKSVAFPSAIRSNLLVSQWVLSGLIHDLGAISAFITEDIMQESSVYQHIIQQGIEQGIEKGERKNALDSLFDVLDVRFDEGAVEEIKSHLEQIEDVERLRRLLREAVRVETLDAFQRVLESNGEFA